MKSNISILILLFSVCSCFHPVPIGEKIVAYADSLMLFYPDSALKVLSNFPLENISEPNIRAQYIVSLTRAQDKCFVPHTSDSLISIAVNYYTTHPNENILYRARAHYYLGAVHRDLGNQLEVVKQYLKALPLAERIDDYELGVLIIGNLGNIYYKNGLLNEAYSLFQKAIQMNKIQNDTMRWVLNLQRSAKVLIQKDSSCYYSKASEQLEKGLYLYEISEKKYPSRKYEIIRSLAYLSERMQDAPKTVYFTNLKMKLDDNLTDSLESYMILGSHYYKQVKYDSAIFCIKKAVMSPKIGTRSNAYLRLADIAEKQGNYKEVAIYYKLYHEAVDSIERNKHPLTIVSSIKDEIKEQIILEHNLETAINQSDNRKLILIIILIGIIIITIIYKIHSIHRSHLEADKVAMRKELWELQKEIEKKRLITTNIKTSILPPPISFLEQTSIFKKFQKASLYENIVLTDDDWQSLINTIEEEYPDFSKKLSQLYPFNPTEIRVCILIKLNFKPVQIAQLVHRSKQSISSIRKRLHIKIFHKEGTPDDFDKFIHTI
ncbi:MAG: tetratricopeptide repeat protein [Bacteroidales bacterium]